MASSSPKASFSSLPPELRVRIYHYLLPTDHQLYPYLGWFKANAGARPYKKEKNPPRTPHYLCTSKLFNSEAAPILYSNNQFWSGSLHVTLMWLRQIGKVNRKYIKHLEIRSLTLNDFDTDPRRFTLTTPKEILLEWIADSCPSLTCLSIGEANITRYGQMQTVLKHLYDWSYIVAQFPQLTNVYFGARFNRLVLSAGALDNRRDGASGYELLSFDEIIQGIKDEEKAKRSVAGKKAAATRKARKEQAASTASTAS